MTHQLANKLNKLVMVVDNNGEIAGGGDEPHACIGRARRMLGGPQQSKYEVLQEAVANHGPEVQSSHIPVWLHWWSMHAQLSGASAFKAVGHSVLKV